MMLYEHMPTRTHTAENRPRILMPIPRERSRKARAKKKEAQDALRALCQQRLQFLQEALNYIDTMLNAYAEKIDPASVPAPDFERALKAERSEFPELEGTLSSLVREHHRPSAFIPQMRRTPGAGGLPKRQSDFIMRTLRLFMRKKPLIVPFLEPVDPKACGALDYFDIISEPCDLSTISRRFENGEYTRADQFRRDMELTFLNATKYNPEGHQIHKDAAELLKVFRSRWQDLPTESARATPRPKRKAPPAPSKRSDPTNEQRDMLKGWVNELRDSGMLDFDGLIPLLEENKGEHGITLNDTQMDIDFSEIRPLMFWKLHDFIQKNYHSWRPNAVVASGSSVLVPSLADIDDGMLDLPIESSDASLPELERVESESEPSEEEDRREISASEEVMDASEKEMFE
eukprot:gnl/Chilomastix_cuspidata/1869.p1 GENE.gnl/Chilomastix_cuspidata/1869~~gnl/Chilomastix_cuspidata/1869.p1  ORF type:complete len:403 (+),score=166.41 gnl/Chilomastix_cuspidata/1869:1218-2426(+)